MLKDLVTQGVITEKITPTNGDIYLAYDETSTRKFFLRCKKTGRTVKETPVLIHGVQHYNQVFEEVEYYIDIHSATSDELLSSIPLKGTMNSLKSTMCGGYDFSVSNSYFVNPILAFTTEQPQETVHPPLGSFAISGNIGTGGQIQIHVLIRPCLLGKDSDWELVCDNSYMYIVCREDTLVMSGQMFIPPEGAEVELARQGSFTKLRYATTGGNVYYTRVYSKDELSPAKAEKDHMHIRFKRIPHINYAIDYKEQYNGWDANLKSYTQATTYYLIDALNLTLNLPGKLTAYGVGFNDKGYLYHQDVNTLMEVNLDTMTEIQRWDNCPNLLPNIDSAYRHTVYHLGVKDNYIFITYLQSNDLLLNIFKIDEVNKSISEVLLGERVGRLPSLYTITLPTGGCTYSTGYTYLYHIVDGVLHKSLSIPSPIEENSSLDKTMETLDLVMECYKQSNNILRSSLNSLSTIIK